MVVSSRPGSLEGEVTYTPVGAQTQDGANARDHEERFERKDVERKVDVPVIVHPESNNA